MTVHQAVASDPGHSAWVSASAGTGKTKVLTDRVLRLLLEGADPSRILCLTYTRAAAAEMKNRLRHRLASWVTLSQDELRADIGKLLHRQGGDGGDSALESQLRQARRLFARVLEAPEGVRIQTIHSLCQQLLGKFPLEAGVSPHFTVLDERSTQDMLQEARLRLFQLERQVEEGNGSHQAEHNNLSHSRALAEALCDFSGNYGEQVFHEILQEIIVKRGSFQDALNEPSAVIRLNQRLYGAMGFEYGMSFSDLLSEFSYFFFQGRAHWEQAMEVLAGGSTRDREHSVLVGEALTAAPEITEPCSSNPEGLKAAFQRLCCFLLTAKNEPRKDVLTKALREKHPAVEDFLRDAQQWMSRFRQRWLALATAQRSEQLLLIAQSLLEIYQQMKRSRGVMDYDDLIMKTRNLLRQADVAPWVLYKLDGGLDHLLVDEAQDTSPEQWEIVKALTEDFFSGTSARTSTERTLFVVGDEKQSIYSFQGADPLVFGAMKEHFSQHIRQSGNEFRAVGLHTSFRSTSPVLQAVDAVFAAESVRRGVVFSDQVVEHEAHRNRHAGRVELWPLVRPEEDREMPPWQIAQRRQEDKTPSRMLAEQIARTIHGWLKEGRRLPARGREIEAQDIMILVRRRNAFVGELVAACKKFQVPVAGVDRLHLLKNIAVQDMLALIRFLLLPQDDLSLAEVLKSPLFNFSEQDLYQLAYGRKGESLWSRLKALGGAKNCDVTLEAAYKKLKYLMNLVDFASPFELFSTILEEWRGYHAFSQRLGEEICDPLNELLEQALVYERSHAVSLQGFLHWLERGEIEIKRDLEQPEGAVRILTVHGTKGLQAPIVFLPDTTGIPQASGRIAQGIHNHGSYFVLLAGSEDEDELSRRMKAERKLRDDQEYRRLLYVAMTRAEDELYICGYSGQTDKVVAETCWYRLIENALRPVAAPVRAAQGGKSMTGDESQEASLEAGMILRLESPQQEVVTPQQQAAQAGDATEAGTAHESIIPSPPAALPLFATQPLAPAGEQHHLIQPSEEPLQQVTPSELISQGNYSALGANPSTEDEDPRRRGQTIHTLLQYLPGLSPEVQEQAARRFLESRYPAQQEKERVESILKEVLQVTEHEEIREILQWPALMEVPITGIFSSAEGVKQRVSGQIDRLAIRDKDVLIIDFKTGYYSTEIQETIPNRYRRQMAFYRRLVQDIYPDRAVNCAIIWTARPEIVYLEEEGELLPEGQLAS